MGIVVQKFGGSSLASPEYIKNVAQKIIEIKNQGNQIITIVSAMGNSTDDLLILADSITKSKYHREMDMLLTTGEQVSISLLSMAIREKGHDAISLTGAQAGIYTDSIYGKAKIIRIDNSRLKKELSSGKIIIVAGFQGRTETGEITTLGRGGSDITAVAIASAIGADVCEIYTDVDGIYTADPRIISNAKKINSISYDEMLELASLGALVLQTRAVEYAKKHNVKICVKSSFNNNKGTIVEEVSFMEKMCLVSGVAHDLDVVKVTIYGVPDIPGIAQRIFKSLAEAAINVDMIAQSNPKDNRNDISFTVGVDDKSRTMNIIENIKIKLGAEGVTLRDNLAKISIVGAGMQLNSGVAANMFEALAEANINIELITTSEIKISCLVELNQSKNAVQAIHNKFKLGDED